MNELYIRNVLEAALLAAGKSLQLAELGHLFDESARPKTEEIKAALDALAAEYSNRAIELKETAAGFRIQVRREFSTEVSRLWPERPARYSRALLETLALIAYRQPITRAEIEAVRGVAVNPNIIKTVIERNWVRVVGHRDVPGRPELLGTTREFLDYFGLRSLDELPPLADLKAMGDYNPQLELPSGAAPSGETSADGAAVGEVPAVPVAGLLGGEVVEVDPAAGEVGVSSGDGAASEGSAAQAIAADFGGGDGDAGHAAVSDSVDADGNVEHAAASDIIDVDGHAGHAAASDSVDADGNVGHTVTSDSVDAEGHVGHATASDSVDVDDHVAYATATDSSHAHADAEDAAVSAVDAENPADLGGASQQTLATLGAHAVARPDAEVSEADGSEAEAERTLAAGDATHAEGNVAQPVSHITPHTAESDDSETSENADEANDALDALEDSAEDDADEDELSADGHDSRELVAAPRDLDD